MATARGLFDARDGNSQVVVVGQRFPDEGLQGFVLVNVPPGKVGERSWCGQLLLPECGGRVHSRTSVVRANGTTWEKHQGNSKIQNPKSKEIPKS